MLNELKAYFGISDQRAFSMLVIAGFSAILVGSVFLIISILVVNNIAGVVGVVPNGSLNTSFSNVLTSIGQALTIAGVALIVVGVAVIVAVLFGNKSMEIKMLVYNSLCELVSMINRNGGRWRNAKISPKWAYPFSFITPHRMVG